jgi:putative Holliday junction resolvase
VAVDLFDERFTTVEAEEILRQAQLSGKRRKQRIDRLAAQILLAAYLEAPDKGHLPPAAIDD